MTDPSLPLLVLDTNVLSYLFRRDPLGVQYAPHLRGHSTVISFQTVAELRYGMEKANWGEQRSGEQEDFMRRFRTIYPTDSVCTHWARAMISARRAGRPVNTANAWIAATALALNAPLVTHNASDFAGIPGLRYCQALKKNLWRLVISMFAENITRHQLLLCGQLPN